MDKFYINAVLHQRGDLTKGWTKIPLPAPKKEIENKVKELGFADIEDIEIFYETNLPEEFTNYIKYGCYLTKENNRTVINFGRKYTRHETLRLYNTFALCLNDLYNENGGDDYITRFITAYAEHSAIIVELSSLPDWCYISDSEKERGISSVAFLTEGTANMIEGYHGFLDYSKIDGDVYVLGAWDIDEFEGECIDDYDDDPVEYLEALSECYDLYIDEYERYILDIYHASKEAEENYNKQLDDRLIELGY